MTGFNLKLETIVADPAKVNLSSDCHVAVIGRSNVGKSSLINLVSTSKGVAKTSATPGKTQTLNFFKANEPFFLVDMPGYGFAKVSKEKRELWNKMVRDYLELFSDRILLLILVDSRHPLQPADIEFWDFVRTYPISKVVVLTKTDAAKQQEQAACKKSIKGWFDAAAEQWPVYQTSAMTGYGKRELIHLILNHIKTYTERN